MAALEKISVRIRTGNREGGGTDGDIYIGICGREFFLDSRRSSTDDFERNSDRTYILGSGSNVRNGINNDPRSPYKLFTENLAFTPTYIRFAPEGNSDNWNLESVTVIVNNGEAQFQALGGSDNLWLGRLSGLYCYLFRNVIG